MEAAGGVKNVVLVHGGFVDGSGWEGVYKILKKDGFKVTVVQNPTVSLADDVAVTKRALAAQNRRHKGAIALMHAWAHSLGSLHGGDEANVMHPGYAPEQAAFGDDATELLSFMIDARLSGAPEVAAEPMRAAYRLWREGKRAEAVAVANEIMYGGPFTYEHWCPYINMIFAVGHLEETVALFERLRTIEQQVMFVSRDLQ